MSIDIVDLKEFYHTPISNNIYLAIKELLYKLRTNAEKSKTLFVGFGIPYADNTKSEFLAMLAHVGVFAWPDSEHNRTLLMYEGEWPFADHLFDEIIVIHGLEYAQNAGYLLEECYRNLRPEGHLVVITPNRRSMWVNNDKTPLGFGNPYTVTQLLRTLKKYDFITLDVKRSLYNYPTCSWLSSVFSMMFEFISSKILQKFSGLVGVVAIKRVYSGISVKKISKECTVPQLS